MIENKITTRTEVFVTSRCPRGFDHPVYPLNFNICKICPLVELGSNYEDSKCIYDEYVPKEVRRVIDEDEDDKSGGLPCDTYMWHIPCAGCGEDIVFTSGYSCLERGNESKCKKCGLIHYYSRWENKQNVFIIPVERKKNKIFSIIKY